MYAKLIDSELHEPHFPLRGERDVFTTDADILREYGFKPVRYTDQPELAENEYTTPIYTETEDEIIVTWEVHEDDTATEADYLAALAELGVQIDEEE